MRVRYGGILVLLGALLFSGSLVLRQAFFALDRSSRLAQACSAQGWLAQNLVLGAGRLARATGELERAERRRLLLEQVDCLETMHHGLVQGQIPSRSPAEFERDRPATVLGFPSGLDAALATFLADARALAEAEASELHADHPALARLRDPVALDGLLASLSSISDAYQDLHARTLAAHSRHFVWLVVGASVVLALMGLLVFTPLVKRIQDEFDRAREAERIQRESHARKTAILDAALDCIVTIDSKGRIQEFNPAAERTFGWSRGEILGRALAETLVPPSLRRAHLEVMRRVVAGAAKGGSEPFPGRRIEVTALHRDGREFPVEMAVTRVPLPGELLFSASIRDLSEREEVRGALRETEERFQVLVEGVEDHALILLDPAGRITTWNTGAERITGYAAEEIVGRHYSCLTRRAAEDPAAAPAPADPALPAQGERRETEGWRVRKDGSRFYADVVVSTLRDGSGNLKGYAKVMRDITSQRRAREELKVRARDLARSNADLEQFAYVAAHDLKEPLRMVASFTELLRERYRGRLDPEADEYIEFASGGARRMQELIDALLNYSRVGTRGGEFAPTDLAAVAREVVGTLRLSIEEKGAEVQIDALPTLSVDTSQMAQLFQNLIGNALKFHSDAPPRIHLSARRTGKQWEFSVRDNGIGIEPQHQERIFVIFQRLHGAGRYPGTGIGLSICKKIVERHDGRIWFESAPGAGTRFLFTLPVRPRSPR